jgi:hypothetical protein
MYEYVSLKLNLSHHTPRRSLGGEACTSCSFSTSALHGVSGQRHAPLYPRGKDPPVHTAQEAGWAPEPIWTEMLEEKSFRLCRGSNLDLSWLSYLPHMYSSYDTETQNKTHRINSHELFSLRITSVFH